MTVSRSGTPDRRPKNRDVEWPQRDMTSVKRRNTPKVGNVKREHAPRRSQRPSNEDGDADAMSVDAERDGNADHNAHLLTSMALAHMIIDHPSHEIYHRHVAALLKSCGPGYGTPLQLQQLVHRLDAIADEFEVPDENADRAVAALARAWCDRAATIVRELAAGQSTPAEIAAAGRTSEQHVAGVNQHRSLQPVQGNLGGQAGTRTMQPADGEASRYSGGLTSGSLDLDRIAKGLDVYWHMDRLGDSPKQAALAILSELFKNGRDIFLVNEIAQGELQAHQHGIPLDLRRLSEQAASAWNYLRPSPRTKLETRFRCLMGGDLRMLANPECDDTRKRLKQEYGQTRPALSHQETGLGSRHGSVHGQLPQPGIAGPPLLVPIKSEAPSSPSLDAPPQTPLDTKAPPLANLGRASDAEVGVVVKITGHRKPKTMKKLCSAALKNKYGYVSVERYGQDENMWLVRLRSAEDADRIAQHSVDLIPWQIGPLRIWRNGVLLDLPSTSEGLRRSQPSAGAVHIIVALGRFTKAPFALQETEDSMIVVVTFDRPYNSPHFTLKIGSFSLERFVEFSPAKTVQCGRCHAMHPDLLDCRPLTVAPAPFINVPNYLRVVPLAV
ncbi:hypothetical protein B0A55_06635 [Friedmanniomyces simplex]|uniref:Uncharacterized protein n=1 Tax=Friedmanniomyces simplex TaxID=329884 RepID=A0A4U0XPR5_9PEZI|nr:hypothetical protein B0A55_06635 [Friedmanniomyces simplex]